MGFDYSQFETLFAAEAIKFNKGCLILNENLRNLILACEPQLSSCTSRKGRQHV